MGWNRRFFEKIAEKSWPGGFLQALARHVQLDVG
jgi:hypothetical protein